MKIVDGKRFCKLIEAKGWELKRIKGSHHIYAKVGENARISVPVHGKHPIETRIAAAFDESSRN